jgi:hypothetical protein
MNKDLDQYSRQELIELINIYSKNWLAMDGLWFQAVEKDGGLDKAMEHDRQIWKHFTKIEATRLKEFLKLPEKAGLEGLAKALKVRFYANINRDEVIIEGHTLIYRAIDCRVQRAREQKGLVFHPCLSVGLIEYSGFAKVIDERFNCECLSCYPEITDGTCCCSWKFTLNNLYISLAALLLFLPPAI